ncbi:MAG: RsmD family RNA methyltransferase, partial [Flavicella sp.]
MRIISGKHKGRRLSAPKNLPVRPTTDMAKESLFNILNNNYYIEDLQVLDLFSGTGNISYEFASRGC